MRLIFAVLSMLSLSSAASAYQTIYVTGRANENTYCSANQGSFCIDSSKRRAESAAEREARWSCEMHNRGRALTYTTYYYTYCNPSYLPINHDPTWVSCRAEAQMQCELP